MTVGDRALVRQLLAGDEAAFAGVVERYHGPLLRLARVFVADREAAEAVVQETWLGVLNGLRSFDGRSSLKTWIFRMLTKKAETRGWRERRSGPLSVLTYADDEPAVEPARFAPGGMWSTPPDRWEDDTHERLLRLDAQIFIGKAIAELPPSQRAVITLRDVEGLNRAEVCHVLEISETDQEIRLHRARSKIRSECERYLVAGEEHVLLRIRGEYLEMPGLRLTAAQARRLWGLDEPTCSQLLQRLVETKFLVCTVDGRYARLTEGALPSPPLRMAKTGIDSTIALRARERPPAA